MDLNPDRISVPGSSMMGITLASQMSVGAGRHALIVSPNWPNIENTLRATGAEIGFVRQRMENGRWTLDPEEILSAVRDHTGAIYINSPCNPTGWIVPASTLEALLAFCRERDIVLIADEVYHRSVYDDEVAPSLMTMATDEDPVIIVNGFSKAWAMTGWRLGWMVAPARYATHIAVLSECFNTGAPSFVQFGGIAALEDGEVLVQALRSQYAGGRDIVMEILGGHPRVELSRPRRRVLRLPPRRANGLESGVRGRAAERTRCRRCPRLYVRAGQRGALPVVLCPLPRATQGGIAAHRHVHRATRVRCRAAGSPRSQAS